MKRQLFVIALLASCGTNSVQTGDAQNVTALKPFDLMHTRPECAHDGKPAAWCTHDDAQAAAALSGMENRVKEMIARATDPAKAKISIAYFSFSNRVVYGALCDKGKAGFQIEGYFDQSYRGQMPSQLQSECQGPAGNNVKIHFLGKTQQAPNFVWRLHHNKYLSVDPGDGSLVSFNFSSGNLSSFGLSVHFDHWAVLSVAPDSNVMRMQNCVNDALRKAINPNDQAQDEMEDDPEVYRETLNACLAEKNTFYASGTKWVDKAIEAERIAPLFSPDPSDANARILMEHIRRVKSGGKIYGAMQHFLHYGIADEMRDAVARGVEVRLIMDDDIITGDSEVPGVREFYDAQLRNELSGITVQFLQTNAAEHQLMHNKFLVMNGVDGNKTRVFSGAGHFTTSGMRNNYENFYLSQADELTAKYDELFNYMWVQSVTEAVASAAGN